LGSIHLNEPNPNFNLVQFRCKSHVINGLGAILWKNLPQFTRRARLNGHYKSQKPYKLEKEHPVCLDDPETNFAELYSVDNPNPPDEIIYAPGYYIYYRIIGWRQFHISCVSRGNPDFCPVKSFLLDQGILLQNIPTVEGYFISDNE